MTQTPSSPQAAPDLPVEWPEPGDARLTWERDSMHFPFPLTPLSVGHSRKVSDARGFRKFVAWIRGLPTADHVRTIYPQGFVYRVEVPPAEQDLPMQEYGHHVADMAPSVLHIWKRELEPEIRAACREIRSGNYASMSVPQLASRLEECMDRAADAYGLTFFAAAPMFACMRPLTDLCREEFGGEGETIAAVLTQGFANESSASDIGLWRLAVKADSLPEVARLFGAGTAEELPARLREVEGGPQWIHTLNQYLDRFGWRSETWTELSNPTWKDSPVPALRIIQRYMAGGQDADPRTALARSASRRRRMARRVASTLASQREKLARFHTSMNMARQYVPIREGRAFWQVTVTGSLRPLCLALGEKLRDAGVLEQAEDVFYLSHEETREIARGATKGTWRDVIQLRRTEREVWMRAEPPPTLGHAPDAASPAQSHPAVEQAGATVLRGTPSSVGVARGRARVVLTLEEADKVQRGDILVCRTTSPAWTFLFSRISAVVTDAGGALSHSAIVAREYGIPCVVGARGATERIHDGMVIAVDGAKGTVSIPG